MKEARVGVTVGKFNPPHMGHAHLIETAATRVDRLYVILGAHPDQTIPATDRARWIEDDSPDNVTVLITPDDIPTANEPWAQRALAILPESPDLAFTSESWGPGWAELMGAEHVNVDPTRSAFPISGTELRRDLRSNFAWLIPAARVDLVRRVVVAGAESTGKTTLAEELADHFGTVWVPEYGREYWNGRSHLVEQDWRHDEFRHIARTHHQIADALAQRAARGLMILDTDALVTDVWHHRYLGGTDHDVAEIAFENRPDLYLVTSPDIPWVQDGTRESRDHRHEMHHYTLDKVARSGSPYFVLEGGREERLHKAIVAIDSNITFPELI
jgi:HTH-type transcriptional regulator, transcriptional repressor of NAD biosynthesis genes